MHRPLAALALVLSLAAGGAAGPLAGAAPCDAAAGTCCCVMANGLRCCGLSARCPSNAISGCPCSGPVRPG
ncbi:hypothetical protein [Mangrovicoccus algicola]|uniref:Uncharacterized protein n=1 Tax=Mangrovicoccus algicola TaxID=2771008 RepID=A0A8J6YXS8_9RHOB|nr:hypothetical protein [Mangrovicoccus algicola]MBE3637763.1 hypothetical protein [Mangrovicoccus algicola]